MEKKFIEKMLDECLFPDSCKNKELVETHISWIALTDQYAFKVKRPVTYSFLDFSILEKRQYFCRREVELNRRLAPEMYLGVLPITEEGVIEEDEASGKEIIDYAVQMERMDNALKMDRLLEENKVSESDLNRLAAKIARFHQDSKAIKDVFDTPGFQEKFEDILSIMDDAGEWLGKEWVKKIKNCVQRSDTYLNGHRSYFNERIIEGFRRDGHGDLNASNIFLYDDPVIFDCIEFNDEFRHLDILNDIAFLCVDLDFYGPESMSEYFYNTYLDYVKMKREEASDRLFSYFKCYRANVRAKVTALSLKESNEQDPDLADVRKYLELMNQYSLQL